MPYFIRLTIEAVILASLVYISCEGSWRAEHGLRQWFLDRPGDHTEYGRNSSFLRVLLDIPVAFYILAAAVVYLLFAGPFNKNFITFISSAVSALSLYYLFLIPAHQLLRKHICSRACVLLWTSPLFLVLIWFLYSTSDLSLLMRRQPLLTIHIPSGISRIILIAWLLPAAFLFTAQIVYHFTAQHRISAAAVPVTDPAVKALLKIECDRIKCSSAPLLYRSGQFCGVLHVSVSIGRIAQIQAECCDGAPQIPQRFLCSGRCNVPYLLLLRTDIHSLALSPSSTDRPLSHIDYLSLPRADPAGRNVFLRLL